MNVLLLLGLPLAVGAALGVATYSISGDAGFAYGVRAAAIGAVVTMVVVAAIFIVRGL